VEELKSRMLKKVKFIGESDGDDDYDYNWDENEIPTVIDNLEDPGLELAGAKPVTVLDNDD
jgi:hypothetical protein